MRGFKSNKTLPLFLIVLAITLGVLAYTKGVIPFPRGRGEKVSEQELNQAKQKALEFIKANLVQEGAEVKIKEITDEKGVYKVVVEVSGQEIISFMTRDLSIFFPTALDIEKGGIVAKKQQSQQELSQQEFPRTDTPDVKLFTQSFCPYGNQAEDLIKPVVEALGSDVEIQPHYVLYEKYQGGGPDYCLDKEGKFCSMHGIDELKQDIRELCVYQDQKDKYWDFVVQVNSDCTVKDVGKCWEDAAKKTKVKISSVQDCQTTQAEKLSAQERSLNVELEVNASPTLIINGVEYQGKRTSEDYKNAICSAFNTPPESCGKVLNSESSVSSGGCGQ